MVKIGYYDDPPSRRMAFDQDGTIVLGVRGDLSEVYEFTESDRIAINNESEDSINLFEGSGSMYLTFIFPERRNVTHYYAAWNKTYHYADIAGDVVQWSNDTTNGMDGTWTTTAVSWQTNTDNADGATSPRTTPGFPDMRTQLNSLPVSGVKAIRFRCVTTSFAGVNSYRIFSHHLYGHKAAGETPHRMDFVFFDASDILQDLDFGDQARNTERYWSPSSVLNVGGALYLRNRSPSLVATDVSLTVEDLTGDMTSNITISLNDTSYATQANWPAIQPQQMVGPIYVKHKVPINEPLGLQTCRLRITVGSWV